MFILHRWFCGVNDCRTIHNISEIVAVLIKVCWKSFDVTVDVVVTALAWAR